MRRRGGSWHVSVMFLVWEPVFCQRGSNGLVVLLLQTFTNLHLTAAVIQVSQSKSVTEHPNVQK